MPNAPLDEAALARLEALAKTDADEFTLAETDELCTAVPALIAALREARASRYLADRLRELAGEES